MKISPRRIHLETFRQLSVENGDSAGGRKERVNFKSTVSAFVFGYWLDFPAQSDEKTEKGFRARSHRCSRLCTVLGSLPRGEIIVSKCLHPRFPPGTILPRLAQRGFHNNRKKGDPRYSGPKRLFLTII